MGTRPGPGAAAGDLRGGSDGSGSDGGGELTAPVWELQPPALVTREAGSAGGPGGN